MKDAYTCEHPVRMTEADGVCGWRVRTHVNTALNMSKRPISHKSEKNDLKEILTRLWSCDHFSRNQGVWSKDSFRKKVSQFKGNTHMAEQISGWPRSLEIRENGQNKFPAGKNQGISKFKKKSGNYQGILQ